jgi:Protein of unknown function (DUF1398)
MASLLDSLQEAYLNSKSYPELALRLIDLGILNYTADVVTGSIIYRSANGTFLWHPGHAFRFIFPDFNLEKTCQAVKDTQAGKTNYPEFMEAIAKAGVRLYEATLEGPNKRVTYFGNGGLYEEPIAFPGQ